MQRLLRERLHVLGIGEALVCLGQQHVGLGLAFGVAALGGQREGLLAVAEAGVEPALVARGAAEQPIAFGQRGGLVLAAGKGQ